MNRRRLSVLVLGVGGNVSQGILKALSLGTLRPRVVAACISAESAGLYWADRAYISPEAEDARFVPWLLDVCRSESIDAVLTGVEPVLSVLAGHRDELEAAGAVAVVSAPEVLEIGQDKLVTSRWLEAEGLPTPQYADATDRDALRRLVTEVGFPLILKPRRGKGGHGVVTVENERELAFHLDQAQGGRGLLAQDKVGTLEDEYTAGCFTTKDGRLVGSVVMRRALSGGTTSFAEFGAFPEVRATAEQIVKRLAPAGPCNVQLRRHDGVPIPFEINVRFSGTTPIRARAGFNEVEAVLRDWVLDEEVASLSASEDYVAIRYWNEVYVDAHALELLRGEGRLDRPRDASQTQAEGTQL